MKNLNSSQKRIVCQVRDNVRIKIQNLIKDFSGYQCDKKTLNKMRKKIHKVLSIYFEDESVINDVSDEILGGIILHRVKSKVLIVNELKKGENN